MRGERPVGQFLVASTLTQKLVHNCFDDLKPDTEGSECAVIEGSPKEPIRPKQILVEFHFQEDHAKAVPRSEAYVRSLKSAGYRVFARSPCDPELCLRSGRRTRGQSGVA